MKKWVISLMILALLGFGVAKFKANIARTLQDTGSQVQIDERDSAPEESDAAIEGIAINVTKDMVYQGDLLLVNKDYPVPKGLHPEAEAVSLIRNAELIDGFGVLDNKVSLSPQMAERFATMVKAAGEEGITHFLISSGYRDKQKQDELYRQMGSKLALPAGYSEHNLGLSLDIGSSQAEMNQAPEGQWLKENAWKYGFILRYPDDKTAITGIQFEPWHFRYVGLPHSAIIQENGFVLEQYMDYLREQGSVSLTVQGHPYRVFYYPVSKDQTIQVPARGEYEISGNNMDGIIVTVRE
ncbi:M15 family metallopeptidase [Paenibacillus phocaensis]|uniref:M15 family metallopeptidase n=1 Tax=Paenibacillus phocaensis TaxID=1776378 RepID=UPI00039B8FD1|nr:M15 family metallopeptidase [Paenibacillus phocaensis]